MKEIKYISNFISGSGTVITVRFRYGVIKLWLRFWFHYGLKLWFPRFRFRNTDGVSKLKNILHIERIKNINIF
jgi:hypothetical protein